MSLREHLAEIFSRSHSEGEASSSLKSVHLVLQLFAKSPSIDLAGILSLIPTTAPFGSSPLM